MSNSSPSLLRTALATGTALAGAYAGLSAAKWAYQRNLSSSLSLPPALALSPRPFEAPDGRVQCYARAGSGPPVVVLHSFNAVASSRELAPVVEHVASKTDRPIYALDWLGFGRSERAAIDYRPGVYRRQLYHFLTEVPRTPVDLIALSLGSEYAAQVALQAAPLVRRLVLVSPTGLGATRGLSAVGKLGLSLADNAGVFELLYYRLTRRASLRDYYARQIFLDPDAIPAPLLDYAEQTAHVRGAHRAPLRFVDGTLKLDDAASLYARLYRPTLFLTPSTPGPTVQSFDRLPEVLTQNERDASHKSLPGGLLPHWEAPTPFFRALDEFLNLR
jgi:pimeloyl-ACP methyl ester carboxylesterase